jgi:hypothetical protein
LFNGNLAPDSWDQFAHNIFFLEGEIVLGARKNQYRNTHGIRRQRYGYLGGYPEGLEELIKHSGAKKIPSIRAIRNSDGVSQSRYYEFLEERVIETICKKALEMSRDLRAGVRPGSFSVITISIEDFDCGYVGGDYGRQSFANPVVYAFAIGVRCNDLPRSLSCAVHRFSPVALHGQFPQPDASIDVLRGN